MTDPQQKNALMSAKAQALLARSHVKGASRGVGASLCVEPPDELPPDFDEELLPYVPKGWCATGRGDDDIAQYWALEPDGRANLCIGISKSLKVAAQTEGAARSPVADDSYQASENMCDHIVAAVDDFTGGNMSGCVDNALDAVGDLAQVAGHLSAGN